MWVVKELPHWRGSTICKSGIGLHALHSARRAPRQVEACAANVLHRVASHTRPESETCLAHCLSIVVVRG